MLTYVRVTNVLFTLVGKLLGAGIAMVGALSLVTFRELALMLHRLQQWDGSWIPEPVTAWVYFISMIGMVYFGVHLLLTHRFPHAPRQ